MAAVVRLEKALRALRIGEEGQRVHEKDSRKMTRAERERELTRTMFSISSMISCFFPRLAVGY